MKSVKFALIGLATMGLVACSQVTIPVTASYTLGDYHVPKNIQRHQTAAVLSVTTPQATPALFSRHIRYMMQPYRLQALSSHQWVAPPAEMLLGILQRGVQDIGYFKAVVAPPYAGLADYQLSSRLLQCREELYRPTPVFRLSVALRLVKLSTGRLMASQQIDVAEPMRTVAAYDAVLAANKAAMRVQRATGRFILLAMRRDG